MSSVPSSKTSVTVAPADGSNVNDAFMQPPSILVTGSAKVTFPSVTVCSASPYTSLQDSLWVSLKSRRTDFTLPRVEPLTDTAAIAHKENRKGSTGKPAREYRETLERVQENP